jgi:hypothetical protein
MQDHQAIVVVVVVDCDNGGKMTAEAHNIKSIHFIEIEGLVKPVARTRDMRRLAAKN